MLGRNRCRPCSTGQPGTSTRILLCLPSPFLFQYAPTEHAQALHRNLAAELMIHAGAGKSPLLPSRIRCPQDPGTAVSINAHIVARRNNFFSSLQERHLVASSPVAAAVSSSQVLRGEGQSMAFRIQNVHPGNPYLQERASIEKRRRDNLAMDTSGTAAPKVWRSMCGHGH